jgi:hypothetical protein
MAMLFSNSTTRALPPVGLHNAVVTGIYNVGSIWDQYKSGWRPNVILQIQLDKVDEMGKPILAIKTLTGSMDPRATMRLWVESLMCRTLSDQEANALDVSAALLGKSCQVQIVHSRKNDGGMTYKIKQFVPATVAVAPASPPLEWDYRSGNYDVCPNWILKKVVTSQEYKAKYPNGGPAEAKLGAPQGFQGGGGQRFQPAPSSMPLTAPVPGGLASAVGQAQDDFDF